MRWTRTCGNKISTSAPVQVSTLILVFAWTAIVAIASIPNVESLSTSTFSFQTQHRSRPTQMFPACQRSKIPHRIAMPSLSTTSRMQASRRSAALNPTGSSEIGLLNQTRSSSSIQEATSLTETTLKPLSSTNHGLPSSYLESKSPERSMNRDTIVAIVTVSAALLLTLFGLLSASGPGGWRYYVAGGTCAAISHAIATPIDVVKVSIVQSSDEQISYDESNL